MNKDLENLRKEIEKKCEEIGCKNERNRILTELDNVNLPAGVWSLIRDIICPPQN